MNSGELDQLVVRIGDRILSRLGLLEPGTRPARPASSGVPAPGALRAGASIAGLIDHTLLRPEATAADVAALCREAVDYRFASVCVNPCWVSLAVAELAGSPVRTCTVAGFPLGAAMTEIKAAEAAAAVRAGAAEIDMVINVGALRSGDYERVRQDIRAVVRVCHEAGAIVKTILETAYLDDHQKAVACAIAKMAGADFVKTSTGFGPAGATEHDVALMRRVVGPEMGVKAAGGIRTLEDLRKMVAAGASRIGASAGVKIVEAAAS
ncbi:MAG: deoxyribose-phosphate aldolase [Bryobacterales bacterium]|nr:deoxyribose-phosphate aldolase [Bryobacterales bacterium]